MTTLEKNIDKYSRKYLNRWVVFFMDLFLSLAVSIAVAIGAYLLGDELVRNSDKFIFVWGFSSAIASVAMFFIVRTYVIIIRHFSFKDTFKFGIVSLGKVALMWASAVFFHMFTKTVFLMLVADFFISTMVFCFVRFVMISVYDNYKAHVRQLQKCARVLVYGLSDKSLATLTRLRNSRHYEIVGFITPDKSTKMSLFSDKQVYTFHSQDDFMDIVESLSLAGILFPTEANVQVEQNNLIKFCIENNVKVLMVPTIDEYSGEELHHFNIREVKIEDLLGRDEIKISLDEIQKNFKDKVVMVTGAAGSIGSELCRQLAGFGVGKLVLFDNGETPMHNLRLELEEKYPELEFVPIIGDVRLERRLDFAFRTHHPQIVFHAAAYKHVPLMEENPCEAVLVNVAGTRNVADKCIQYGIEKMVMVSTDKAVNPTNIMGCTKRLAEIYVQSLGQAIAARKVDGKTKFVTTRFGNVLGSNGSVIPRFRQQIAKGGPVTVTHPDITRFFMTIPEACRLVMEAATMPTENRICVFDMGTPVKIDTLARRMIKLSGLEPDKDIKVVYTGLRPGEKLYEEVLSNVENTDPTSHDRIRIAHVRTYDYNDAKVAVDKLEELSRAVEIPDMVRMMKQIVPEYISNNSKFQEYDAKK
ncbi:MAG: nucleoside-diphosphate sugar epimerase/dehydratase [Bacteroidia bacterium]|nr:nucleoside-diphosphate sugar epimerase/dehydratase [Bacteroidia bacterium]